MATYPVIRMELDKACILQQQRLSDLEVEVIAKEWSETFSHISDYHFVKAMRRHRKQSGFLPREHEIERLAHEISSEEARARAAQTACPEETVPKTARCAYNAAKAKKIIALLFAPALAKGTSQTRTL